MAGAEFCSSTIDIRDAFSISVSRPHIAYGGVTRPVELQEAVGSAEDGEPSPDNAGAATGHDALVVPVDGNGGGRDAQLHEYGVAARRG